MKLQHSLIALAVLGMGAAQAAPLTPADAAAANAVYVSGSSALRFSMASGFVSMCDSTTIAVFGNKNGAAAPGNNVRGYACKLATAIKPKNGAVAFAAGTNVVFNKYDAGGSINGIQPLVKNTALPYMTYSAANCTATGFVRSGTFDLTKIDYACDQTNNVVPQMGISDVEAATIQNKTNLAAGVTAVATTTLTGGPHSVAMAGVAVNLSLYRALQTAQGLTQDDAEANAPSIPVAFLATVEAGQASPFSGTGFNALIPDNGTDTGSGNQAVTYCSRNNGSGTKAMHSAFLLNAPCSAAGLAQVGGDTTAVGVSEQGAGDFVLNLQGSTGNVITCMQGAGGDQTVTSAGLHKNWAIGLVGSENDSLAGAGTPADTNWRFVKVSGVFPNQANGQVGAYPMTYENYMYWKSSGLPAAITSFARWLQTDAVTPLALAATPDAGTRKGILAIADITNPAFASVTSYVARTSRFGSSCKPQVLTQ